MIAVNVSMRRARQKRGLSIVSLSIMSGVHKNSISGYETGKNWPSLCNLISLADALEIGIDEYIGRNV